MPDTGTDDQSEPGTTSITLRLTESFLNDIDATWREDGYNSRSEFIRHVLRDTVKHPGLTRESWKEIAAVEYARRTDEGETFSREELLADE